MLGPGLRNAGTPITLDASRLERPRRRDRRIPLGLRRQRQRSTRSRADPLTSHTFGAAGTVEPTVTVVDARGESATRTLTLTVLPRIADTQGETSTSPPAPRTPKPPVDEAAAAEARALTVTGLPRSAACPRPRRVKVRVRATAKGIKLKSITLMLGSGTRAKATGKRVTQALSLGQAAELAAHREDRRAHDGRQDPALLQALRDLLRLALSARAAGG